MSHESAPATELVATSCCACGRALVDSESLASGIGPVCAEKFGGRDVLDPEVRAEANRLIYRLAILQRSPAAIPLLERLRELGFEALAKKIGERLEEWVEVRAELHDVGGESRVVLTFPQIDSRADFDALVADLRAIPGRRWEEVPGVGKRNTLPRTKTANKAFLVLVARHFPGRVVRTPKRFFTTPSNLVPSRAA